MPVGIGDEKIVCAGKVVVEPRVDFYPVLRASEFRPAEVVHVKADCRRVDEFRALLLPTSPASGEFVVSEQVEIKFLEHFAGALFICVRKVCPRDMLDGNGMVQVVVDSDRPLDCA